MPDRLELVKGPPARAPRASRPARRRALAAARGDRREYSRVLAQRNALLAAHPRGRASRATLADAGTASSPRWRSRCARTAPRRSDAARRAVRRARRASSACSGRGGARVPPPLARGATRRSSSRSCASAWRATSSAASPAHGPHRDELALLRDGRELRIYGSQGEQRLALLALLLAERSVLARERDRTPLMLLDDVMSELDATRRELLARRAVAARGQSVIATTDLAHVPGARRRAVDAPARLARDDPPGGAGRMSRTRPAPAVARARRADGGARPGERSRASRRSGSAPSARRSPPPARPTSERDGVLTVTCEAAVWAQELDLMAAS